MWTALWIVLGLVVTDRVLLWMESRGWIYWRRTRGSGGAGDSVLLELQKIMRPSVEHVQHVKQQEKAPDVEEGDPPAPSR